MGSNGKQPAPTKSRASRGGRRAPRVRLGKVAPNGVSPSMYGLVDRGALKRPGIARDLRGRVELRFKEDYAPVRLSFGAEEVVVEDIETRNGRRKPDLVISGSLPDVVALTAAPLWGGLPKVTDARGRAALARMAGGKVKVDGSAVLARRLLKLLEI